ncbi:NAD(P)-binding domain-containing protein [Macrococcus lamae]|uniref:6-phosphogluconate dehydrogenase NADP-binding domain-containing protein n=1 Tax=Macrococcus lamae TaxID=198484 RepID=A0A4R6BVR0_9STAP|nr:NAD(P)-binding domain-containing protein [Macrococcus lamae]TDM12383.1 hypothetical protein ERX29_03400 [Macrococcus lamae]
MDAHQLKEEFIAEQYDSIMLATTSNHSSDFLRLPDKLINSQKCMSFSIASETIAKEIISLFDELAFYIYVDVERKQNIDLYKLVNDNICSARLREIKPNDLAMDAADILIYKSVKDKDKNIIIVGTGNIGIKLAIRLAERNYNVFLHGRNQEKVDLFVKMINEMLPKYTKQIKVWDKEPIDVLCTMISATEVIDERYLDYFNEGAIAIDGGIGNFKKSFIKRALAEGYDVLRLDVRISNDVLNGIDQSFNSTFFTEIKGERTLNTVHIVSGGIIGQSGDIIVDRIVKPKRVIGAANGIGGVKREDELSIEDHEKIRLVNEAIKEQKSC